MLPKYIKYVAWGAAVHTWDTSTLKVSVSLLTSRWVQYNMGNLPPKRLNFKTQPLGFVTQYLPTRIKETTTTTGNISSTITKTQN